MKFTKFDIGAEIISILTKGMYQDPRDALREYVQNGIDAGAKDITIKVRNNSVSIIDTGIGMDYRTMRRAIRVGVSDKDPKKKVGFMGIGIYSSFHLCDKLIIHSRQEGQNPNKLEMDFLSMRNELFTQRQSRIEGTIDSNELKDLQSLLEDYIILSDENQMSVEDFPSIGTRVDIVGLEANFLNMVSSFDNLSIYLQDVVPLHFDENNFMWAKLIENKIAEVCRAHGSEFQLINLLLQVNNRTESLYRPYRNTDFSNGIPLEPIFKEINKNDIFFGVTWGCLNSTRNKIQKKDLRGFLIKKQGFAIGNRDKVASYFKQRNHFDRYIGEIVATNPHLLPNASRSDLEFSEYNTMFTQLLADIIAPFYNQNSTRNQEQNIADEQIAEIKGSLAILNVDYRRDEKESKKLVDFIVELNSKLEIIGNKEKNSALTPSQQDSFKALKDNINTLIIEIKDSIANLSSTIQPTTKKKARTNSQVALGKKIQKVKSVEIKEAQYENLMAVFADLDIDLSDEIIGIFEIVDEQIIQALAKNEKEYAELLSSLRTSIINSVE